MHHAFLARTAINIEIKYENDNLLRSIYDNITQTVLNAAANMVNIVSIWFVMCFFVYNFFPMSDYDCQIL